MYVFSAVTFRLKYDIWKILCWRMWKKIPALEIKYGGSSPSAVPRPHRTASSWTWGNILLRGILTNESGRDVNNGGPNSEQSFSSQEGADLSWMVSYGAVLRSTRPQCKALIVKKAMWGPKYRTNVCKPDPEKRKLKNWYSLISAMLWDVSNIPWMLFLTNYVAYSLCSLGSSWFCTHYYYSNCSEILGSKGTSY